MKWILVLLHVTLSLEIWAQPIPVTPVPELTTGHLCSEEDPHFRNFRYAEKIPWCRRRVSSGHRTRIYEAYNIPEECRHRYTIDHFIPLSIGGSNHSLNLWPEHKLVKATRQRFELDIYLALKNGEIYQEEALELMVEEKTRLELDLSEIKGCG